MNTGGYLTRSMAAAALLMAGCETGGTGLGLNLVSEQEAERMGVEAWRDIRSGTPLSDRAQDRQRAESVAQRVLRAAGEDPARWEVAVFKGAEPNAFALPARKIGIYEGMMRLADTDDQLAAVLAHEVGHVLEGHSAERVSSAMAADIGAELAGAALGAAGVGSPGTIAALLGAGVQYGILLPYSRNQELEADRVGLSVMAQAAYDPRGALALWEKMRRGDHPPAFLSTHPAPEDRIEHLRAQLPQAMAAYAAAR